MTPNELVTELRHKADTGKWRGQISLTKRELIRQAADTIERLEAENRDLRHRTFESKNQPLTLEELRQMKGKPIYFYCPKADCGSWRTIGDVNMRGYIRFSHFCDEQIEEYGKTWLAYRSKPSEEEEQ